MEPATALEQILFASRRAATRDDVYAWWPPDTRWTSRGTSLLAPSTAIAPFHHVEYVFIAEKLYNLKLVTTIGGDYAAFEAMERDVQRQLPSVAAWTELGDPWSTARARARLEHKGNEKVMVAVPIAGLVPRAGELGGKAVAFRRDGAQHYGFELYWAPA